MQLRIISQVLFLLLSVPLIAGAAVVKPYAYVGSDLRTIGHVDGLTAIGSCAYAGAALEEAVVPDGVKRIGNHAFAGCKSLWRAVIPEGVTVIEPYTFSGCTSLDEVTLPSTVTVIGEGAFSASGLSRVDLSGCTALKEIGAACFAGCDALREVVLPEGVLAVGDDAFFGCGALEVLALPRSLTVLGARSLACVDKLGVLGLPASLAMIGDNAMERMDCLTGIDAAGVEVVPMLGDEVWRGLDCGSIWLSVAPGLRDTYASTPQWCDFHISSGTVAVEPVVSAGRPVTKAFYTISGMALASEPESGVYIEVTLSADGSVSVKKIIR